MNSSVGTVVHHWPSKLFVFLTTHWPFFCKMKEHERNPGEKLHAQFSDCSHLRPFEYIFASYSYSQAYTFDICLEKSRRGVVEGVYIFSSSSGCKIVCCRPVFEHVSDLYPCHDERHPSSHVPKYGGAIIHMVFQGWHFKAHGCKGSPASPNCQFKQTTCLTDQLLSSNICCDTNNIDMFCCLGMLYV